LNGRYLLESDRVVLGVREGKGKRERERLQLYFRETDTLIDN